MGSWPLDELPARALSIPGEDADVLYPEMVADELEMLWRHYTRKKKGTWLVAAIETAAIMRVPLPQWCFCALEEAMEKWQSGECREFGEAIGMMRPGHWRQHDHRRRHGSVDGLPRYLRLYKAVKAAHDAGYPLNPPDSPRGSAFDVAAQEFAISPKTVETWYYETKRALERQARARRLIAKQRRNKK